MGTAGRALGRDLAQTRGAHQKTAPVGFTRLVLRGFHGHTFEPAIELYHQVWTRTRLFRARGGMCPQSRPSTPFPRTKLSVVFAQAKVQKLILRRICH